MEQWIASAASWVWGWPMIILLIGTHILLTVRLRFPQRNIFKAIRLSVTNDKDAEGEVSQFGALVTSLAATIGTGNIVGVATAIALGGPGAVFWCWISGILGIATKYSEALLAVKYRVTSPDGRMLGGPMYALEHGLGMKWLGVLFSIFCAVAAFGIGNMVQANAIAVVLADNYGVDNWITGVVVAVLLGIVLIGGIKGLARICTALIPFMAAFYVVGCVIIVILNGAYIWPAVQLIVSSAFSPQALGGGLAGGSAILAIRFGVARGLFSNESGLGSAPIVAAAAKTNNPVRQAYVSSTGTFWDTVVICALTGIVIVSTCLHYPDIEFASDKANLTHQAFSQIPWVGSPMLAFSIVIFAFSTILGWSYYGERCVEYLCGARLVLPYRIMFVIAVMVGCNVQLMMVWNLADLFNALMALPNLIALVFLSGVIVAETRKHHSPFDK